MVASRGARLPDPRAAPAGTGTATWSPSPRRPPAQRRLACWWAPSAESGTICERSARYRAVLARRAHQVSCSRSAPVSTSSALGRPIWASSSSSASPPAARPAALLAHRHRRAPSATSYLSVRGALAAANTIRARVAARGADITDRRTSSARSPSDNTTSTADGPRFAITTRYKLSW